MNKTLIEDAKLIDSLLQTESEEAHVEPREAVEWDEAQKGALTIVKKVLEQAGGQSFTDLGRLVAEAAQKVEEDNNLTTGDIGVPALIALESLTAGVRQAVMERVGEDPNGRPDLDPVEHAFRYYMSHGRFPELTSKKAITGAMKKIASLPKK